MNNDLISRMTTGLRTRASLAMAFVLASGCASPFQGKWKGECDVGVGSSRINMPLEIDLVDSKGTTVRGAGTFGYNDFGFEGEARGRIDEETLLLDIFGVYGGYTITLELEGELASAVESAAASDSAAVSASVAVVAPAAVCCWSAI